MFLLFRTHAWVPGYLGGRSRGAWAALLGPWGTSQGAPRGGVPAESLRPVGGRASCGFASKIMSILMLIFDRFGVDLGPLLEVIFGHVGTFFGPSWSRNRLRTVLSSKK